MTTIILLFLVAVLMDSYEYCLWEQLQGHEGRKERKLEALTWLAVTQATTLKL